VSLAQAAGAEIHAREKVLDWAPIAGGGVRVQSDRGTYEAGRLVLSTGAWIADFVPALKPLAVPERQVLGWFQPADPAKYRPGAFPVSILEVEEGPYFMLPIWGAPGVKIGLHHHQGERGHADALSRETTREDEALLRICLARYTPEANGPVMSLRACLYTNAPDEHFIIDSLPGEAEVIVASPCSGHGYKFASVIGEIIADLATKGESAFDLSMFRLGRF
jgi:sarcosine oxidase